MGGGGFLSGALRTATGVAAGALAFEGIESLMHGFGHEAGYGGGQGFGSFDGSQRPTEEVSHGSSDASSNDRDSLYGSDSSDSVDDASFDSDTSTDDADGSDFGDDGSGGGDDSSFA
jgi:uncharacterized protein